jgi:Big-like domain-containing protein
MPHTTPLSVRRALVVLLAGSLGCSSDLVLPEGPEQSGSISLTKFDGDTQTGTVGEQLSKPLIVQVFTESRDPVPGYQVVFALGDPSSGSVSPDTAETDAQGRAIAEWTLGTVPGPKVATARLVGDTVQARITEFTAIAMAAPPDTLSAQSPQAQPGVRKKPVTTPPQVRVVDRYGNPIPDAPVSWQVVAGRGTVSESTTLTDAEGKATTQWTLGDRIGVQKLTATVADVTIPSLVFTATVFF